VTIPGPPGTVATVISSRPTPLDPTAARTTIGEAVFDGISGIEPATIHDISARWLSARSEIPILEETLPAARSIAVTSRINASAVPDLAFFNGQPIDLAGEAFFPFGERPKLNDAFYLGSEDIFSKTGA